MVSNGGPALLPAKQFNVWSRLYGRFLLEPGPAVGGNAYVSPVILPVTDADRLLKTADIETSQVTVTGIARFVVLTVTEGERWTILFWRTRRSGGVWNLDEFSVVTPTGVRMTVHQFTSNPTAELWELQQPLELDEGWDMEVNVDAHTSDGLMTTDLFILREDAF